VDFIDCCKPSVRKNFRLSRVSILLNGVQARYEPNCLATYGKPFCRARIFRTEALGAMSAQIRSADTATFASGCRCSSLTNARPQALSWDRSRRRRSSRSTLAPRIQAFCTQAPVKQFAVRPYLSCWV
jgi:hypothetical protein